MGAVREPGRLELCHLIRNPGADERESDATRRSLSRPAGVQRDYLERRICGWTYKRTPTFPKGALHKAAPPFPGTCSRVSHLFDIIGLPSCPPSRVTHEKMATNMQATYALPPRPEAPPRVGASKAGKMSYEMGLRARPRGSRPLNPENRVEGFGAKAKAVVCPVVARITGQDKQLPRSAGISNLFPSCFRMHQGQR